MKNKLLYWIPTGLLCLMMLGSAGMYIFNYEEVAKTFELLGFPVFVIYPLATLKILGVIAILTNQNKTITEWAYAGFFFNFLLAGSGHIMAGDGEAVGAFVAMALLIISRYFWNLREA